MATYDNPRSLNLTVASRYAHAERVRCGHWQTRMGEIAHPCNQRFSPLTLGRYARGTCIPSNRSPIPLVLASGRLSVSIEVMDPSHSNPWSQLWLYLGRRRMMS